jgi:hypothetical protein
VEFDHAFEEFDLSLDNVHELLAGRRRGAEANEIDRMARIQGVADLAFGLEAANAGPLAGARVHHHDRPLAIVSRDSWRWHNARQSVVDWAWKQAPVHQHFVAEAQHGRQWS